MLVESVNWVRVGFVSLRRLCVKYKVPHANENCNQSSRLNSAARVESSAAPESGCVQSLLVIPLACSYWAIHLCQRLGWAAWKRSAVVGTCRTSPKYLFF